MARSFRFDADDEFEDRRDFRKAQKQARQQARLERKAARRREEVLDDYNQVERQ